MPKIRAHVVITGRVQGVCFRAETQRVANNYALTGWVRNMPDGNVEAIFEGQEEDVGKMIRWCHKGPPHAHVQAVSIKNEPFRDEFDRFSISYY